LKTGFFGGSFDPVHRGHLFMARKAYDHIGLDRLIFIPAYQNPLKENIPANTNHRLNMLSLAIKQDPRFSISDFEITNGGKSYTINTVKHIKNIYKDDSLFILIGGDSAASFDKWKDYQEILSSCTPVIFKRKNNNIPDLFLKDAIIIDFDCPYSSTEIRNELSAGKIPSEALPDGVSEYIHQHRLYSKVG